MHNGVPHSFTIEDHQININSRATMVGLSTNGCIHHSSEFIEYTLEIDGENVPAPPKSWTDKNGLPFGNIRSGTFDTPEKATEWATYSITGNRHTENKLETINTHS